MEALCGLIEFVCEEISDFREGKILNRLPLVSERGLGDRGTNRAQQAGARTEEKATANRSA